MPRGVTRLRTRLVPHPKSGAVRTGTWYQYYNNKWNLGYPTPDITVVPNTPYKTIEACRDETHKHGVVWNEGGPFLKIKVSLPKPELQGWGDYNSGSGVVYTPGLGYVPVRYVGGYTNPTFTGDSYSSADYANFSKMLNPSITVPSLDGWGPAAWAKTAPKIEMASGFVFLAESRDLPRMMKTSSEAFHDTWRQMGGSSISANMAPKKAADQFLNHEFGWSPFLSDLQKFYNAYQNTANYMSRMSHGNDQWQHYRRTLVDDFQTTKLDSGTGFRCEPAGYIHETMFSEPGKANWEVWEEKYSLIQTSGVFKWYKPEFDLSQPGYSSAWNRVMRQATMYGVRVSPSNIWRATPWTWLIDWGLNVGQNIDRVTESLLDGVVSKYLYLMSHQIRRVVLKQYIPFNTGGRLLQWARVIESKQRKEAGSPYGFGLSWDQLNPKRLAILAALGISRK